MNREILFRGKCERTGLWRFGYLSNKDVINTDNGRIKIIPATIGQFTGLTDKNGVKIWEGDKVKFKCSRQGEESQFYEQTEIIRFRTGCFCVGSTPLADWNWRGDSIQSAKITYRNHVYDMGYGADKSYYKDFDMEVIGNIHDNPELIK